MASTSLKEPKFNRLFNDARLVMSVLIQNGKGVFEGLKSLQEALEP